jgi:hypothetical protein
METNKNFHTLRPNVGTQLENMLKYCGAYNWTGGVK